MPPTPPVSRLPEHVRRLGKVHHVALIVRSIEDSLGLWRDALGLELETVMDIPYDRVRIAFLGVGESKIELVEPTDDTTGVARFLESKGEGFHHVCFEVPNLAEALLHLEIDGIELIDSAPRRGAEGPVAFLHPRSCHGVLVELIEAPGGPAWRRSGSEPDPARQPGFVATSENISGSSPPASGGRRQRAVLVGDEEVGLPLEERVLDERLDPQPGVDQRGHDLAEAVVPAVLGLLADVGRRVRVRALDREGQRLVVLPVRIGRGGARRRPRPRSRRPPRPGGSPR